MYSYSTVELSDLEMIEPLPKCVLPTKYHLKIYPFVTNDTFEGSVTILVDCVEETDTIVLHAGKELEVAEKDISITNQGLELTIVSISRDENAQTLTVKVERNLCAMDSYELKFTFKGNFKSASRQNSYGGLYVDSWYDHLNAKSRPFAVAQLFPNHAKKVFPCFDEPGLKAPFQVIIGRKSNMNTVSTTSLKSSMKDESREDWILDCYECTPPIATFSLGFLVSDYMTIEEDVDTGLGHIVVKKHCEEREGHMAEENTKLFPNKIKFFTESLGYLFSKLEIGFSLNINNSEEINAMGFSMMRIHPTFGGRERRFWIPNQWLHHYITPQWWSNFRVIHYLCAFLTDLADLSTGEKKSWFEESWENDIFEDLAVIDLRLHDKLATERGVWVFHMLKSILTYNAIKEALNKILADKKYGTYTEKMLWNALNDVAHQRGTLPETVSVEDIAKSWFHDTSHNIPVLTVKRNYYENSASLKQNVLLMTEPENIKELEGSKMWWLPVSYLSSDQLETLTLSPVIWMAEKHFTIANLPDSDSFIIVNPQNDGMFVVNYDTKNWNLIIQTLMSAPDLVPEITRKKLLHDALLLNTINQLDLFTALNMTLFLFNEKNSIVWISLFKWLKNLVELCRWTPAEDKLNVYVRMLLESKTNICEGGTYRSGNFLRKISDEEMLQMKSEQLLDKVGYQELVDRQHNVIKKNMSTFTEYDKDSELLLFFPTFFNTTVCDFQGWTKEMNDFVIILRMMPFYRIDKYHNFREYIQRLMAWLAMDKSAKFSTRALDSIVQLLVNSPGSQKMALTFFIQNFKVFKRRFFFFRGAWKSLMSKLTSTVSTKEGLMELIEFREQHKDDLGLSLSILDDSMSSVKKKVDWIDGNMAELMYWLQPAIGEESAGKFRKLKHRPEPLEI